MKKQIMIVGMVVLLVCVGLSGCFENNTADTRNSELDRFVGTWVGKHGSVSFQNNETWTFYENRSLKIVDHEWDEIDLGSYNLEGTELKIRIPDTEDPRYVYTMWYNYTFSDSDTKLVIENSINLKGEFTKQ